MRERGGRYDDEIQRAMMGMSSTEWSRYLHETAGLPDRREINAEVVQRMLAAYREHLPLVDGAVEAVQRLAARFPLAVASSSNRPLIDAVLERLRPERATSRRPSPPRRSRTGSRRPTSTSRRRAGSASPRPLRRDRGLAQRHPVGRAAGMRVIAIPNPTIRPTRTRSLRPTS